MRVLFFLQPAIEFGNPEFRFTTVKNTLAAQAKALRACGHETIIVASTAIIQRGRKEGLLDGWGLTIRLDPIEWTNNEGYESFTERHLNNDLKAGEATRLGALLSRQLPADYKPDIIVSWETPASFFADVFPGVHVMHQTPGLFSRPPFPFLLSVDTGLLANNSLERWDGIDHAIPAFQEMRVRDRLIFESADAISVELAKFNQKFSNIVLLPLQVDNYFMVTTQNPYGRTQFELLTHVLSNIPKNIGVLVTNYRSKDTESVTLTPGNIRYLRSKFENFIFIEATDNVPNASQSLVPLVDGVITISSSVGYQAAYWQKPLFVTGNNHISPFASSTKLEEFLNQVRRRDLPQRDNVLESAITTRNIPFERIVREPQWFSNWLEQFAKTGVISQWAHNLHEAGLEDYRRENDFLRGALKAFEVPRNFSVSHLPGLGEAIERHEIISFDIFDTLLQRPYQLPRDLFAAVSKEVPEEELAQIDFSRARIAAEKSAFEIALSESRGEITLDEIYAALHNSTNISLETCERLKRAEIQLELDLLYPRRSGLSAFRAAIARGKRVILISDMYLPKDVIVRTLTANGIVGYEKLFLSHEYGAKKHSGRLFETVLQELQVNPKIILHIGDNEIGDIKRAGEKGMDTFHLPKAYETYVAQGAYSQVWQRDAARHSPDWKMIVAIIANRLHDNPLVPHRRGTIFSGGPWKLGYSGFGPLLLAFTKWLIETAISDGKTDLFFLSRDGKILKQAYDIVAARYPEAPKSHYLLCSRRAVNLAKATNFNHIRELVNMPFGNGVALGHLLKHRFGLEPDPNVIEILVSEGRAWETRIKESDVTELLPLFHKLTDLILQNASRERASYLRYLQTTGISQSASSGVVDIGYAGTMQESLSEFSGLRGSLSGYYLLTFRPALGRSRRTGMPMKGFLGDFVDRHDTHNPFCRHVPLYETLFSSAETSLVKFDEADGEVEPIYMEASPEDVPRAKFVTTVHDGALEFITEVCGVLKHHLQVMDLEPNKAIRTLETFFNKPHERDARMLSGVSFEDFYGGQYRRDLLPLGPVSGRPVWVQGLDAIKSPPKGVVQPSGKHSQITATVNRDAVTTTGPTTGADWEDKFRLSKNAHDLRAAAEAYLADGRKNDALRVLKLAATLLPKNKRLRKRLLVTKHPLLEHFIGKNEYVPKR